MRREPTFDPMILDEEEEVRPLKQARPFWRLRLAGRFVIAAGLIAGLTIIARETTQAPPGSRPWSEPSRMAAKPLPKPAETMIPLLRYDAAEADPPARPETPRWSPATGQREDTLAGGGFDAIEAPFLRVTLTDPRPDPTAQASLFVSLARRAAEQGLSVLRTGQRGQVETKFGPFETVEATLSGAGSRHCLGFQSLSERAPRFDGWLCGILGQAPEPPALACAIDRIGLALPAGLSLEAAFEQAEARRTPRCGAEEVAVKRVRASEATGSIAMGADRAATLSKARNRKGDAAARENRQAWQ